MGDRERNAHFWAFCDSHSHIAHSWAFERRCEPIAHFWAIGSQRPLLGVSRAACVHRPLLGVSADLRSQRPLLGVWPFRPFLGDWPDGAAAPARAPGSTHPPAAPRPFRGAGSSRRQAAPRGAFGGKPKGALAPAGPWLTQACRPKLAIRAYSYPSSPIFGRFVQGVCAHFWAFREGVAPNFGRFARDSGSAQPACAFRRRFSAQFWAFRRVFRCCKIYTRCTRFRRNFGVQKCTLRELRGQAAWIRAAKRNTRSGAVFGEAWRRD